MSPLMEKNRHDYSDDEDMDDSDQATGLLSHERTTLSMPRHSQQQQQQPYRYYPDDNQGVFGDLENHSDTLDFGKRMKKVRSMDIVGH